MWIKEVSLSLICLANSAVLASGEGTFDKDMNDSALDLYKSTGI